MLTTGTRMYDIVRTQDAGTWYVLTMLTGVRCHVYLV